jgi:hypothetical protein
MVSNILQIFVGLGLLVSICGFVVRYFGKSYGVGGAEGSTSADCQERSKAIFKTWLTRGIEFEGNFLRMGIAYR